MFENFDPIDIEEEATRRRALVDKMNARDEEIEEDDGDALEDEND